MYVPTLEKQRPRNEITSARLRIDRELRCLLFLRLFTKIHLVKQCQPFSVCKWSLKPTHKWNGTAGLRIWIWSLMFILNCSKVFSRQEWMFQKNQKLFTNSRFCSYFFSNGISYLKTSRLDVKDLNMSVSVLVLTHTYHFYWCLTPFSQLLLFLFRKANSRTQMSVTLNLPFNQMLYIWSLKITPKWNNVHGWFKDSEIKFNVYFEFFKLWY